MPSLPWKTTLTTIRLYPLAMGVWLVAAPGWATAAESLIELRDGTVLRGELISVEGGAYRIRTRSLGEIQVRESDVAAIRPQGSTGGGAGPGQAGTSATGAAAGGRDLQGELAAIQQRMAGDPDTMQAIMGLQGDPEIQAALADPALVRLILSGDLEALRADPRFQRLMGHPGIQGILDRATAP